MVNDDLEISTEPLWNVPQPIQERMLATHKDREYQHFLLCGIFSAVAISFLVLFGIIALLRDETSFATVIFGFAFATLLTYSIAWFSHYYRFTKHALTLLMALLCLYLFYSGGTENTGPLYYFVFPLVAIFLQGMRAGMVSVVTLLLVTILFFLGTFGFDTSRYTKTFFARVLTIYTIISMLAIVFENFRIKAERELLLCIDDLNQLSFGDLTTNLANRRLLEKLLVAELLRLKRYPQAFCIMMIEPDLQRTATRTGFRLTPQSRRHLAQLLDKHLREPDVAGCWDDSRFMVLLPQTSSEGARSLAERLLAEFNQQDLAGTRVGLSIGIGNYEGESAEQLVLNASSALAQARREGGARIVIA